MASGPITSWQIEGGKVETVTDFIFFIFIFLGLHNQEAQAQAQVTEDSDCSQEIKRCLLLGRKAVTDLKE